MRGRVRFFRIGPRNGPTIGLITSRSSAGPLNLVNVTAEEAEETPTAANEDTENECSDEQALVCAYIDRIVSDCNDEVPDEYVCTITHCAIRVPVVASDGFTYERSAIRRWMKTSCHSPKTRESLDYKLFDNHALCKSMQRWAREHAKQELGRALDVMGRFRI